MISAALAIFTILALILSPTSWLKGHGETSFLIVGVIYAGVGVWFGARHRVREWLVALCLSSSYLLTLAYVVYSLCRYNQEYGGRFWSNKFYFSPVFLYASIPLAAFLGARFGSKRSFRRMAALMCLFVATVVAIGYARGGPREAKLLSHSFNITDETPDELVMRVDVKMGVQGTDEPMAFRVIPSAGGSDGKDDGGWVVTVIRRSETFQPDTQMTMYVDGKELHNTMWPVNPSDGSMTIDGQKHDYSQIEKWRIGVDPDLDVALVNAHRIQMTWGNRYLVLPEQQVNSLRDFFRSWGQLLHDEDMLCTNPQCDQPLSSRR